MWKICHYLTNSGLIYWKEEKKGLWFAIYPACQHTFCQFGGRQGIIAQENVSISFASLKERIPFSLNLNSFSSCPKEIGSKFSEVEFAFYILLKIKKTTTFSACVQSKGKRWLGSVSRSPI